MSHEHHYSLLGLAMDAGSWADWFAGAASFAAVGTALAGYWISGRYRRRDQRDRELRASESAAWKTIQVLNFNDNIRRHILDELARPDNGSRPQFSFTKVRPLGVIPHGVTDLAADELSILIRARAADIAMDISECVARLESVRFAMQEYKTRHEALFELLPPPTVGDGTMFQHDLTAEQASRALPYQRMLESLLRDTLALAEINREKVRDLLVRIPPAMQAYFGEWTLKFEGPTDGSPPDAD